MLLLYILLGIIALGILLLSDAGRELVASAMGLAILTGLVMGIFVVAIFLYSVRDQIGAGLNSVLPTLIAIGLLIWLGKKIEVINKTEDSKLGKVGKFVKHTGATKMTLYVIGLIVLIELVMSILPH